MMSKWIVDGNISFEAAGFTVDDRGQLVLSDGEGGVVATFAAGRWSWIKRG